MNQPTRCNNFSSLLLDVYLQLNVFRASSRPSSGATTTAVAASGLPSELGDGSAVGRGRTGRPDRPRPTALLSPRCEGKTRGCYCSCWASDDGREDARNTLSCKYIFFNSRFLASWINVNQNFQLDATVCSHLFTAKSLYMFRVSQHLSSEALKTVTATSGIGHNTGTATSYQRGLLRTTVFSAPDDGCCDARNMYSDFAVNKCLRIVASSWTFLLT